MSTSTDNNYYLLVNYLDSINVSEIRPGWRGSQSFTINNMSNVTLMYNIKLTNVVNTFDPVNDFVYSLKRDGINVKSRVIAPTTDTIILENIIIPGHMSYTYELIYEFLEKNIDQNVNQGRIFNAQINVEAVN